MTTLAYGAITITISDDLLWVDEYQWNPVVQRRGYSVTGKLLVDSAAKQSGRPITLGGDENAGWATRTVVDQLLTAASIPGQQFTLTLRGVAHTVIFDHDRGGFEATPIFGVSDPLDGDFYAITLRLIKV